MWSFQDSSFRRERYEKGNILPEDSSAAFVFHTWKKISNLRINVNIFTLLRMFRRINLHGDNLTHCIRNRPSHTIYWKTPISILGTSGYEIYIFLAEKWLNYLQTVETLIRRHVLWHLIWVCTVCQLPFYGYPDYNGLNESFQIHTNKGLQYLSFKSISKICWTLAPDKAKN